MKLRNLLAILSLLGAGLAAAQAPVPEPAPAAPAQPVKVDPLSAHILEMFRQHAGKTLCALGDLPLPAVRALVVEQLRAAGLTESATQAQVERAVWTSLPCPFSPFRRELVAARAGDVQGAWLFPESSQPYRFGPKSEQQPARREEAITCEAVAFFPDGEYRTGTVLGRRNCPFEKAADLDPARKRPRVASWAIGPDGRLAVTRTDVRDHVEEWDVYIATRTFNALAMEIRAGDLVAYRRKDRDNEVNAATEFRHLQKLP